MTQVLKHLLQSKLLVLSALLLVFACSSGPGSRSAAEIPAGDPSHEGRADMRNSITGIEQELESKQFDSALTKVEGLIQTEKRVPALHLLKARILMKQGKEQEALDYLTGRVLDDPDNPGMLAARGQFLLENGYLESARNDFLLAYQQNYRSVEILKVLVAIEQNNGNLNEALKLVDEALKLDSGDHDLWFSKARLEIRLNQAASARESVGNAIRLSEETLKYHQFHLEVLGYLKDGDEINRQIRKLAQKFPDDEWVAIRYATLLYTTGEQTRAKEILIRAVAKHPASYLLLFQLGTVYAAEKNWPESIRMFEAGLKEKPDSTWAMVQLAKIHFQSAKTEQAIDYLQQARAAESEDPFVYETLAKYYNRQNDTFEAEEIILEGLAINPQNEDLLLEYAALLEKRANYREAIKAYEKALAMRLTDHVILGRLGNLYRLILDFDQSKSYFKRAIAIKPDVSWVRSYYVELLADTESWREALEEIDKILGITPDDYWAYAKKAQIENELGDFDKAHRSIKRAIELRPDAPWLKEIEANTLESLRQYKAAESAFKEDLAETPDSAYLLMRLAYVQLHLDRTEALRSIEAALDSEDFDISTIELYLFLTGQHRRYWGFREGSRESLAYETIIHKRFDQADPLLKDIDLKQSVHYPFLAALFRLLHKEGGSVLSENAGCTAEKSAWHCFYAGMDAMRRKEWPRAREIFQQGLEKNPENIWLMVKLAYVHQHLDEHLPAIDLLERYLAGRSTGRSIWVKLRLALNCVLSQQYKKAEAVYLEILKADPDDNVALNNLAWMYLTAKDKTMKRTDEALRLATKAVEFSPSPANLDTLAEAYYQKKEYHKALKMAEQALDRDRRGLDDFKKTQKKILKAIEASQEK